MKAKKPRTKTVLGMSFKLLRSSEEGETWASTQSNILDPKVYLDLIRWDDGTCSWSATSVDIETEAGFRSPQEALKGLYSSLQEAANEQQRSMQFIAKRTANTWTGQRLAGKIP